MINNVPDFCTNFPLFNSTVVPDEDDTSRNIPESPQDMPTSPINHPTADVRVDHCLFKNFKNLKTQNWKKQFDPKFPRAQPLESYPLHEKQRTSRHPCPEGIFPLLICMSLWQKDAEYRFFSVRNTYLLISSRMCFA